MIHDPMCPTVNADVPFGLFHDDVTDDCLFCPLVAAVRQDERAAALDAARQAVDKHKVSGYFCSCGAEVNTINGHLNTVIDALRNG